MILTIEELSQPTWAYVIGLGIVFGIAFICFLYGLIRAIILSKEYPDPMYQEYEEGEEEKFSQIERRPSWVEEDLSRFGAFILFGGCAALIFGIFFGVWLFKTPSDFDKYNQWYAAEYEEVTYDHIYSMDLKNEVSGSFRLGYGKVETKNYYYFYIKTDEDMYTMKKLENKGNDVFIKETDNYGAIIQRKDKDSDFVYYVINVPHGTVIEAYSIN